MSNKISSVMIAGCKSGSGKTLITCGIIRHFTEKGYRVVACKAGPDYIDPLFHRMVDGVSSMNLDTWLSEPQQVRKLFAGGVRGAGSVYADRRYSKTEQADVITGGRAADTVDTIVVAEGVMGLFDGVGGTGPRGSSYDLASTLGIPIILVADVSGMGGSMIPLLKGFLDYDRDRESLIKGVILNKISQDFYKKMQPGLDRELSVPVLGYVPSDPGLKLESRYLGLALPDSGSMGRLKSKVGSIKSHICRGVDMEGIEELARQFDDGFVFEKGNEYSSLGIHSSKILAIARDEAFCFYYRENLELLESLGAEIRYFSPLRDSVLPKGTAGILLGGGYPELYGLQLSSNKSMLRAVREAHNAGIPSLAECGGFMYLHTDMQGEDGEVYEMAGLVKGLVYRTERPVRFGYMELLAGGWGEEYRIKGHEFHYYESECNGADCIAVKPVAENLQKDYPSAESSIGNCHNKRAADIVLPEESGEEDKKTPPESLRGHRCAHMGDRYLWGFPHLYYPSCPGFIRAFADKMKNINKA